MASRYGFVKLKCRRSAKGEGSGGGKNPPSYGRVFRRGDLNSTICPKGLDRRFGHVPHTAGSKPFVPTPIFRFGFIAIAIGIEIELPANASNLSPGGKYPTFRFQVLPLFDPDPDPDPDSDSDYPKWPKR